MCTPDLTPVSSAVPANEIIVYNIVFILIASTYDLYDDSFLQFNAALTIHFIYTLPCQGWHTFAA